MMAAGLIAFAIVIASIALIAVVYGIMYFIDPKRANVAALKVISLLENLRRVKKGEAYKPRESDPRGKPVDGGVTIHEPVRIPEDLRHPGTHARPAHHPSAKKP